MATEHRLERRARLLAERMRGASESLAQQLGAGERTPFTTAMTRSESLAWWREHRHDEYGQKVLERMQPWDIARLDADLGLYVNQEMPQPMPTPQPDVPGLVA